MQGSLSRPAERRIADEVPWVRPPADLESGKEEADVLVMETGPSKPHLSKFSAPALPYPQGGDRKKVTSQGGEHTGENPVEASGFLLASLAVSLLSRGLGLTIV